MKVDYSYLMINQLISQLLRNHSESAEISHFSIRKDLAITDKSEMNKK